MASSLAPTFLAALRAVGTAATMAGAGFYLHRRNFVTPSGKKMLALISQQVTIPAFLFAKIIYCPSGGDSSSSSSGENDAMMDDTPEEFIVCPTVASRISDLWMLLLWPGYVVLCGLLTGYLAAKISNTPPLQTRSCLAACAFGNSTGLPITLLSVIHKQFKKSTELGRIDPTAFLSVYLLLYPVLQWGAGGWLLAPEEKTKSDDKEMIEVTKLEQGNNKTNGEAGSNGIQEGTPLLPDLDQSQHRGHLRRHTYTHISHILNYEDPLQSPSIAAGQEEFGGVRSRRLLLKESESGQHWKPVDTSNNALAMMVRELSFTSIGDQKGSVTSLGSQRGSYEQMASPGRFSRPTRTNSYTKNGESTYLLPPQQPEPEMGGDDGPLTMDAEGEASAALSKMIVDTSTPTILEHSPLPNRRVSASPPIVTNDRMDNYASIPRVPSRQQIQTMQEADIMPLTETMLRILRKVFQPPVIGALLGLFIASFPHLRGVFENIWGDNGKTAPLHFLFDGIYSVGQAAVPINMIILGINLSSTFRKKSPKKDTDEHDGDKSQLLSNETMIATVIGKMIVMPIIGMFSCWVLEKYYIDLPDEIDATCYLVMMIVFICPTANNVMVMVELSGSSSKEGMARLIGWQYLVSPIVLSFVLSAVVRLATCHFDVSASTSPMCSA